MKICKKFMVFTISLMFFGTVISSITIGEFYKESYEDDVILGHYNIDELLDQQQTETEDDLEAKIPFGKELDDKKINLAQSFQPTLPILTRVDLLFKKTYSYNGVTVYIKDALDVNTTLASASLANSQINSYPSWTTFNFDNVELMPNDTYFIICTSDASVLTLTYEWYIGFRDGDPIDNYDRGISYIYQDYEWESQSGIDFCFKTYGVFNISENDAPVANFSWSPAGPKINEIVTFDASTSYDPDGTIISYEWDWDNDGVYDESNDIPTTTHTWSTSDSYSVTLRVTDNNDVRDTKTKNVNVYDIIVPDDYPKIQDAIDQSLDGYSIFVRSNGIYFENLIIDLELLTLHGENRKNTVIDGGVKGDVIHLTYNACVTKISGFTIQNSGNNYVGVKTESDYNSFADNEIVGNGIALQAISSSGNNIKGNIINNNTEGINIDTNSHSINIIDNNIAGNIDNGILIDFKCTGNIIDSNTISYNGECGICINDVSHTTKVTTNTISNNDVGIKSLDFSDGNLFHHNSLVYNNINAFDNSINHWDNYVIGNYWSDYTGVDNNGDGIGDTPYYIPGGNNKDRYPLMDPWQPPTKPSKPLGEVNVKVRKKYDYSTTSSDIDNNRIKYGWDWNGDKNVDEWTDFFNSGEIATASHTFTNRGSYQIYVIAKDENNQKSAWSEPLPISVSLNKKSELQNRFLIWERILNKLNFFNILMDLIKNKQNDGYDFSISETTFTDSFIIVPDNYPTIHEAVEHSKDGDEIFVRAGTYNENILVDKSIKINGEGSDKTFVEGGGRNSHIFHVKANNVEISNFTIRNSTISCSGIRLLDDNYHNISRCNIHDNILSECGGGVELYWTDNNTIYNNTVINNNYDNKSGWGTFISYSKDCFIEKNILMNNYIGMEIGFSSINVKNNTIEKNNDTGIYQIQSNFVNEDNNNISNNGDKGLRIFSSTNNTITNNILMDNNNNGITIYNSTNNVFFNNKLITSNYVFINNPGYTSLNSDLGIAMLFKSNDNLLYDNTFTINCTAYDTCDNQWDDGKIGNCWCDYVGKDYDGDGIGDYPYIILGGNNQDRYPLVGPCDD